ncbi:ArsR family transcriptional regulator [Candidatus Woesearchaeota archaeon]|nr:MAG: ArsR family transcriptional regulator [Candidatus Woesearchaeota archaeon]
MTDPVRIFKALSDETRFRIVEALLESEKCVCEIVPLTGRCQSTVSIQLGKLQNLGIVSSRREGKNVFYKVSDKSIKSILKAANKSKGGNGK